MMVSASNAVLLIRGFAVLSAFPALNRKKKGRKGRTEDTEGTEVGEQSDVGSRSCLFERSPTSLSTIKDRGRLGKGLSFFLLDHDHQPTIIAGERQSIDH
jgi:hypothetical protein